MSVIDSAVWAKVRKTLEEKGQSLLQQNCCVGFDGYIDSLFRVVRAKEDDGTVHYYRTIEEFGMRILRAAGQSADTEIKPVEVKLGGNAPILAAAFASLGASVTCIAPIGAPDIRKPFEQLAKSCTCISLGEPCDSTALEFEDGKLMFGSIANHERLLWPDVVSTVGFTEFVRIFKENSVFGLVNWSGLPGMNSILHGLLSEVLPKLDRDELKNKLFFVDLADPSARSREDFHEVMGMLKQLSAHARVMLGLNENEARYVRRMLIQDEENGERQSDSGGTENNGQTTHAGQHSQTEQDIRQVGLDIENALGITAAVIHLRDRAFAFAQGIVAESGGFYVDKPACSTGGGDNFNGGFLTGQLLGLDLAHSLLLGNAVSSLYVSKGASPDIPGLIEYGSRKLQESITA